MFRICKIFEIESGHILSRHPDNCRFPHGHSRRVEVILEAGGLDGNGMVCDFKAVNEAAGDYLASFDHALCVNTSDPMFASLRSAYGERVIAFEDTEPTTEVIARQFFQEIRKRLAEHAMRPDAKYGIRPDVRLACVRVWETSTSWAEYGEP